MKYGPHEIRKLVMDLQDDIREVDTAKKMREETLRSYTAVIEELEAVCEDLEAAGYGK